MEEVGENDEMAGAQRENSRAAAVAVVVVLRISSLSVDRCFCGVLMGFKPTSSSFLLVYRGHRAVLWRPYAVF
jgi:hypothetical protein